MKRRQSKNEQGAAIIIVLMLSLVALALVAAMLLFAGTSTPLARDDQDWNASLSAAEAGVDDYLYRLSKDSSYWQKATDPNNQALVSATALPTAPGVAVPGGSSDSKFKYSAIGPNQTLNGTVKLKVQGTVRDNKRTVEATLRRDGFLDYLYFSKFETVDPLSYSTSASARPTRTWAETNCGDRYYYPVGSSGQSGYIPPRDTTGDNSTTNPSTWVCSEIRWVTGDTLDGPLHTNDALRVDGDPIFKKKVTTSWAKTLSSAGDHRWIQHDSTASNPAFQDPFNNKSAVEPEKNEPVVATRLDPPADNSELEADAIAEGCVYDGPTFIKLKAAGTGKPTWDVVSPGTAFTAACGGGGGAQTNVVGPNNFNGVIYVRNKATCRSATGTLDYPIHPNASYKYPPGLPVPVIETVVTGLTTAQKRDITTYDCLAGDAFVQGTLDGQLTIGAKNNIVITNHVKYDKDPAVDANSDDVLGLITNNFIEVIHPVRSDQAATPTYTNISGYWDSVMYPTTAADRDPVIMAAMLSVKHSFRFQQHDKGARPGSTANLLKVRGAIAQIYRGPVGTSGSPGTGWLKDYKYDSRLQLLSPPHFLDPVQSAWKVKTWAEIKS